MYTVWWPINCWELHTAMEPSFGRRPWSFLFQKKCQSEMMWHTFFMAGKPSIHFRQVIEDGLWYIYIYTYIRFATVRLSKWCLSGRKSQLLQCEGLQADFAHLKQCGTPKNEPCLPSWSLLLAIRTPSLFFQTKLHPCKAHVIWVLKIGTPPNIHPLMVKSSGWFNPIAG